MATSIKVPATLASLDNGVYTHSSTDKWNVSVEHYLSQDSNSIVFLDPEKTWSKQSIEQNCREEDSGKRACLNHASIGYGILAVHALMGN